MEPWLIAALTGSVAGSIVTLIWQHVREVDATERKRSSAKQVLQAEVDHAEEVARSYLEPKAVTSPGWRISARIYPQAFEALLSVNALDRVTTSAILDYYGAIEAFNRSLDAIASLGVSTAGAGTMGASVALSMTASAEIGRARLKALALVSAKGLEEILNNPAVEPGIQNEAQIRLTKCGGRAPYDVVRAALSKI